MGKPITVNVKEDPEYFKKYYHSTKEDYICECGCVINNHSKRRHLLSKKHTYSLACLVKLKEKYEMLNSTLLENPCSLKSILNT